MQPQIVTLAAKKLIGQRLPMSLADNQTGRLWQSFRPRLPEVANRATSELISLQKYARDYFQRFDPTRTFEKWAAAEVTTYDNLPVGMETLDLAGGEYAVFHYQGLSTDSRIFQYIYTEWLPASGYQLDDRPHFEVLGAGYRNNDPSSEEDIYIPVRR